MPVTAPRSEVYQYGINSTSVTHEISYDPAVRIYASNDTATFDLSWSSPSSRRALEVVTDVNETEPGQMSASSPELELGMQQELGFQLDVVEDHLKKELETVNSNVNLEIDSTKLQLETLVSNVKEDVGSINHELEYLRGLIEGIVSQISSEYASSTPLQQDQVPPGSQSFVKKLWEQLHTESWLVDPEKTNRTLKELGVETEEDMVQLDQEQLEYLAENFKPEPKKEFMSVLF